jgi:HD superfamily phosphohydrolase
MSKLINLFSDFDKLEGTKSYKTWKRLIESTLIYNELWRDICNEDTKPNKPTDAATLAKWEVKNAKALALIKSSVNDEMYVHIENTIDAWSALKFFKDLFDTQPESKKVDLQLKLLQQKLTEGGDVHEYISRLKNIKQEILNVGFQAVDDSFMTTILIVGLPSSYTHFLETLQVTGKLDKLTFDELSEMLSQHNKTFDLKLCRLGF